MEFVNICLYCEDDHADHYDKDGVIAVGTNDNVPQSLLARLSSLGWSGPVMIMMMLIVASVKSRQFFANSGLGEMNYGTIDNQ